MLKKISYICFYTVLITPCASKKEAEYPRYIVLHPHTTQREPSYYLQLGYVEVDSADTKGILNNPVLFKMKIQDTSVINLWKEINNFAVNRQMEYSYDNVSAYYKLDFENQQAQKLTLLRNFMTPDSSFLTHTVKKQLQELFFNPILYTKEQKKFALIFKIDFLKHEW